MSNDDAGEELTFGEVWGHIGALTEELLGHPDPEVVRQSEELLDWVDVFHRDGLGRMVEMMRAWRGELFLNSLAADELTGTMLAAYGLGEGEDLAADAAEAVDRALDEVRPLVESHGGALQVETIKDGVVALRMLGTCDGCPSSSATLTYGVEAALRDHWPNFRHLELLDPPSETDPEKAELECFTGDGAAGAVKVELRDRSSR
ncbi:MAG TPA: NifU family protein [Acidimicrobiales bacterium]|jgi:Fe-S cluster biogenesis protein NfuA|nr:NifU family protein [Acidimicrobiales bacterium]